MIIGILLAVIAFISNWIMQIHSDSSPNSYQLIEISFYYFTPLFSWFVITLMINWYYPNFQPSQVSLKKGIQLMLIAALLSPFIRSFDILLDFSIKYFLGMVLTNPFLILQDVWLVVISSSPFAILNMLVIYAVVHYFRRNENHLVVLNLTKVRGEHVRIPETEILFIQSQANYVDIHTCREVHKIRITLKEVFNTLGNDFFRIHRSTLVNVKYIESLKHWRNGEYLIKMQNGKHLTSSKTYKDQIDAIKSIAAVTNEQLSHPELDTVHPIAG